MWNVVSLETSKIQILSSEHLARKSGKNPAIQRGSGKCRGIKEMTGNVQIVEYQWMNGLALSLLDELEILVQSGV